MWRFIKKKLLLVIVLIAIIRGIMLAPYLWDEKPAIKIIIFGVGLLNLTMFLLYNKYNKINSIPQAAQCDACGLFVPLGRENNISALKPHCCYMKPK